MNNNVILMAEFSIKSGELDNFKALVKEMVEATQANEPDTIIFDFHQRDGKSQIMERYVDSVAAMTHSEISGEVGDRPWAFLSRGFKVSADPSDD